MSCDLHFFGWLLLASVGGCAVGVLIMLLLVIARDPEPDPPAVREYDY